MLPARAKLRRPSQQLRKKMLGNENFAPEGVLNQTG